jgi:parvulin-like peptidyl-prolyl isomerase
VAVISKELEPAGDASRKDSAIVARVNNDKIHWGEVKTFMTSGAGKDPLKQRMNALDGLIDEKIMTAKAREIGLEKDPVFQARVNEFKKTSLINLHQGMLFKKFAPQDAEVRSYYDKNKNKIIQPESRNVQMVVLKSRKEAEEVSKKIKSKEMTVFEAARDYSIDPNAKQNLGQIGWVAQGTGFPELDKLTFSLKQDELGGPVETPAGWHLVKVLDVRDALYTNIKDKNTWETTRRMLLHEKLDRYTADLRQNKFTVTVYEDVFKQLVEKEAKTISEKDASEKKQQGDTDKGK